MLYVGRTSNVSLNRSPFKLRKLFGYLLKILLLILIGIISAEYYFEVVNPVGKRVAVDVAKQVQVRHTEFITYGEIPPVFREAVISTEDRTFFSNSGVDPASILRSIIVDLKDGQYTQGGSTITQQLVRNALPITDRKSIARKLIESIDAIGITHDLSKQQIFTLYVNDVYYGQGAYGLYNAAETYFGLPPQSLNSGELTLLAGLPNAPSVYDPIRSLSLARSRQQYVVQSMVHNEVITQKEASQILFQSIRLKKV